jgi:hypothetical protein
MNDLLRSRKKIFTEKKRMSATIFLRKGRVNLNHHEKITGERKKLFECPSAKN